MQICHQVAEKIETTVETTIRHVVTTMDKVCSWLPWPLDELCHLVTRVVEWFEHIVNTVVSTILRTICRTVDLVESLAKQIPLVGPVIRLVEGVAGAATKFAGWVASVATGTIDFLAGLVGIRLRKQMSLDIVILRDEENQPLLNSANLAAAVAASEQTLRSRANIQVTTRIRTAPGPAPHVALTVDSNTGLFGEDLTVTGDYFRSLIAASPTNESPAAAVVCFVVRGVGTATENGCSGGPLLDYICIEATTLSSSAAGSYDPTVLPHEIGHALGLLHDNFAADEKKGDSTNLMFWASSPPASLRGTNLSPFQEALIRVSPQVTY